MRVLFLISFLVLSLLSKAQRWPEEFSGSKGKLVLYQPQMQKLDGAKVSGVAAISVLLTGKKEPQFGALFFDAFLNIDRDTRQYTLERVHIPNLKFSGTTEGFNEEELKTYIIEQVLAMGITGSLDELLATVEEYKADTKQNEQFKNDPPKFIYTTDPSVLIMIDGDPKFQDIKNTDLRYVANTGYVIMENKSDRKLYLYGGDIWYVASQLGGPWQTTKSIPKDIQKLLDANKEAAKSAGKVETTGKDAPPNVIIGTAPTELIQTKGQPVWKKYDSVDISLEYAENTEDNLFKSGTQFYVLKSGRWFSSSSLSAGWKYIAPDQLPKDFAKIPSGSPKDIVLASVPGTVEARDALLDAQVPQTATVDRKTAGKDVKATYDGKPQFEKIEGTSMDLAKNSDKTVFRVGTIPTGSQAGKAVHDQPKYYMVDNGIWYVSSSPDGPWYASDHRPAEVDNIPPSSSAYNTKYVYVYDSTPDVIYVGYTPGYMGSYVYGPTVVYGTGYYYQPWYGAMYYPHHATWGFNMNYNPWTGWSIGFGFTTGPFHFGFGTGGFAFGMSFGYGYPMYGGYYGMFGPPMYRPPCFPPAYPWYGYNRPGYGGGNRPINSPGSGNINWGGGNQINIGGDVNINVGGNQGNSIKGNNNLYNKSKQPGVSTGIASRDMSKMNVGNGGKPSTGTRPSGPAAGAKPSTQPKPSTGARPSSPAARPSTQPNNVFADKGGNVYQRDKSGNINQNTGGNNWSKPSSPNKNMYNPTNDRNRGSNRASSYTPSRPASKPMPSSRPSGGGGMRRR
jgi:hypothetical protein